MEDRDPRSLADLLSSLTGDLATLVRKESQLLRAEATEKLSALQRTLVGVAAGGALTMSALVVLLTAAVSALSRVIDPVLAGLLVGGLAGLAGYLVVKAAVAHLNPANLAPDRSTRQLQNDVQLVKDQVQ